MLRSRNALLVSMFFAFVCSGSARAQDASLLPTKLAFPSQAVGTTSGVQAVTLTDTDGAHAMTISTIVASGDFTETNTCGSSVAAGKSCTISVQFAPTAIGAIDGSVTIFDNAPGSPQALVLTGTGIARETVSPSSLNFGTVAIGETSAIKTIKLTNNTVSSITITGITASGGFTAIPAGTGGCGSTLAANASCTEDVFFTPTELGAVDGSVIFEDASSQQYVTLTGKGSGTADSPITLTPATLTFGNQSVGTTSADQGVVIKNTGATSLRLTIAASGSYLKSNPGSGACSSSLAAGASCTIDVQFSPAVLGAIDGGVSVSYSGTNSPQIVGLTGTGIGQVTISPTSIAFSPQQVDTTSAFHKVTVTNNSSSAISVNSIVPSADFKETDTCGGSIAVGTSCAISISFAPTRGGLVLGSVIITDSATSSPQVVDLSGSGFLVSRFAYVPNFSSGTISVYTVNPKTGQLRSNGYVLAESSTATAATVDPSGKFLYAAGGGTPVSGGTISAYTINASTGQLTLVTGSPWATEGGAAAQVTVDPSGKFVYVLNQGNYFESADGSVSAFTIDGGTGALTPVMGSPFTTGVGAASMAIDPTGRFAYVGNFGDQQGENLPGDVSAYTIDPTSGALTPIAGSPFLRSSGAYAVAVAPSGEFGYVLGETSTNEITAFSINPTTGVPTVAGSPFTLGEAANVHSMVITPSGKFIYVVGDNPTGTIAALSINAATGAVTPVTGSPFATGDNPEFATIDPNGTLLYVTNDGSGEIWTYTIAGNGTLTLLNKARTQQGGGQVALGGGSASVMYTPKFAYVANGNGFANNVSAYTINASNGHLAAVSGSPFATGTLPVSVAVDPSGRFAYVANENGGSVSAYTINSSSGVLTPISGSPFAAGNGPVSVTVDPSGRFAYVANGANGGGGSPGPSISAYTINTSTGVLTAISGSPYSTGANSDPEMLEVDPTGQFLYMTNLSTTAGNNGNILAFSINFSTGALTALSGSPFTGGVDNPFSVAVDPSGRFAYVTNRVADNAATDGNISAYDIDASTGALSEITGSPFTTGIFPFSVQVDPLGNFVYVTSASIFSSNNVYGYSLDATTGALTSLTASPFSTGAADAPNGMAMDPSGRFAYVANNVGDDVTAFTINPQTGDLNIISGEGAVPAGTNPTSVATTGTIH
jgi:6-phosphogluconolactonase (cycloisomerase 2 family)